MKPIDLTVTQTSTMIQEITGMNLEIPIVVQFDWRCFS